MADQDDALFGYMGDLKADLIHLKLNPKDASVLESIKDDLNNIFPGTSCKSVLYTPNTDKLFFGIVVLPLFSNTTQPIDIAMGDNSFKISNYKLELDSKLFDNYTGLNIDEILSLILHEVGSLIIDDTPGRKVRYYIDSYLAQNGEVLKISDYISYIELLGFGIKDAMRKCTSVFMSNTDYEPSQLDDAFELSRFINSAMDKLASLGDLWNKDVDGSYIVIEWTLRLYDDILTYRIPALHTLKKALLFTASELEKSEIRNLITRLDRIDDESLIRESTELDTADKQNAYNAILREEDKNWKKYEEDYTLIEGDIEDISTNEDAHIMLHKLNQYLTHMDNCLETMDFDPQTKERFTAVRENYSSLRNNLIEALS